MFKFTCVGIAFVLIVALMIASLLPPSKQGSPPKEELCLIPYKVERAEELNWPVEEKAKFLEAKSDPILWSVNADPAQKPWRLINLIEKASAKNYERWAWENGPRMVMLLSKKHKTELLTRFKIMKDGTALLSDEGPCPVGAVSGILFHVSQCAKGDKFNENALVNSDEW